VEGTNEADTILTQQGRLQVKLQLSYVVRLDVWHLGIEFSFSRKPVDLPAFGRKVPGDSGFAVT
jgi:hypothetical protein